MKTLGGVKKKKHESTPGLDQWTCGDLLQFQMIS